MLSQQESITLLVPGVYASDVLRASLEAYCSGPVRARSVAYGDHPADLALMYARRNADHGTERFKELLASARAALNLGGVVITAVGYALEFELAEQRRLEFGGAEGYNIKTT